MSFDKEMAELIQKYIFETRGEELNIEEILQRPRWKRVLYWWKALERYKGTPIPEMSVEEVKNIYGD